MTCPAKSTVAWLVAAPFVVAYAARGFIMETIFPIRLLHGGDPDPSDSVGSRFEEPQPCGLTE